MLIQKKQNKKTKKATKNPNTEDDKSFQYVVTIALNYEKI